MNSRSLHCDIASIFRHCFNYRWTDLWLNEGFASYVEYLGVEAVHPEFKIMEQFVTRDVQVRK